MQGLMSHLGHSVKIEISYGDGQSYTLTGQQIFLDVNYATGDVYPSFFQHCDITIRIRGAISVEQEKETKKSSSKRRVTLKDGVQLEK